MIEYPASAILSIHIRSLPSLISAGVMLLTSLIALAFLPFTRRRQEVLAALGFQFALLAYLLGFGIFSTSLTLGQVIFWTRICFTGAIAVPLALYFLVGVITRQYFKMVAWGMLFVTLLFLGALWSGESLVTYTLKPMLFGGQPILAIGHFYPLMVAYILVPTVFLIGRLIKFLYSSPVFKKASWSLIVGLVFWVLTSFRDGVIAVGIIDSGEILPWIGPVFMFFMFGIFAVEFTRDRNRVLSLTVTEKEMFYERMIRDSLTGVYRRDYLINALEEAFASLTYQNQQVHSLLFVDVDNMKWINDSHGHLAGDEVLCDLAGILKTVVRRGDMIARVGGDEFVVLLYDCPAEGAVKIAREVKNRFREMSRGKWPEYSTARTGLSIGICCSHFWEGDAITILDQADKAMYRAKMAGKHTIAWVTGKEADGSLILQPVGLTRSPHPSVGESLGAAD